MHTGLERACFGYAVAVAFRRTRARVSRSTPRTAGTPRDSNLYEFDRKAEEFRYLGVGVIEGSARPGAAAGLYQGRPAVYASWFKRTPTGGAPKIDGQGITAYYRGDDGKVAGPRIVKTLQFDAASPAIAVGDLNGDGLDDVVWGDESAHRIRVFFQTAAGEFEELAPTGSPRS